MFQNDRVACPHNPKHLIHAASVDKHAEICPKLEKGYSREELVSWFYFTSKLQIIVYKYILLVSLKLEIYIDVVFCANENSHRYCVEVYTPCEMFIKQCLGFQSLC